MKRTLFLLVTIFALFFSLNKVEAQTGSGLDTLTLVNGWQLVEYAPGVTFAKTWFTNVDPYHGSYSQFFEVDRNSPNVANDREFCAIFKKKLPKTIKKREFFQYSYKYSHSKPNFGVESPLLDVAFGNDSVQTKFKNIVNENSDSWFTYPISTNDMEIDSIKYLYLRISGNFKVTVIQVDYFAFVDPTTGFIFDVIEDFEDSTIVGVEDELSMPTNYSLSQNYPNPFNPETTIKFQIPTFSHVTLKIFDVLGREVETLVNEDRFAGEYTVKFSGLNLASGMYIYQINIGNGQFVQTKKMILVK